LVTKVVILLSGFAIIIFIFQFITFFSFQQKVAVSEKPSSLAESQKRMSSQLEALLEKMETSSSEMRTKVEALLEKMETSSSEMRTKVDVLEKLLSQTICQEFLDTEEALRWTGYLIDTLAKKEVPSLEKRNRLSTISKDFTEDGMFKIPEGIKRIWIDVGADWGSFAGESLVVNREFRVDKPSLRSEFINSSDILSISIEANGEYYNRLKLINRVIPLPIVMSNKEGILSFKEYEGPGCSSLLNPEINSSPHIPQLCKVIKKVHQIPSLRLERIIDMIPTEFPIEFLKVDAQGVDVDVIKSAGITIKRVKKIIIEVQSRTNSTQINFLYKGTNTKQDATEYMDKIGFELNRVESFMESEAIGEENLVFDNTI